MKPRVFISYSWSSPGHQDRIRKWAEQLINDGVDVVLDIWDLKEGDDKYAFMEKMVTDESVTHVLVFSDSGYTAKADARKAGVGTESQIISREVYSKVQQSKFIPVVCEFNGDSEPFLPTFFQSRIWIDFSSPEAANENWERLIRVLYGKPMHEKPALGNAPIYVATDGSVPASPAAAKFAALKQALNRGRNVKLYRQDFLDACIRYADALRIRKRPDVPNMDQRVLEDCGKLKLVRDQILDWVVLESADNSSDEFSETLISVLERLLELKSRPPEVNSWNDVWFEAHRVFVYETFLYIIAALLKTASFGCLNQILTSHYLLPETEASGSNWFGTFDRFYGDSTSLQILASEGKTLYAPAAELIKRQADRTDLPFADVMQAELLVLMMAFVTEDCRWWYPQTLHYAPYTGGFPFFLKAARNRDFRKLATIAGIDSADTLRAAVKAGHEKLGVNRWYNFSMRDRSFWDSMNMDALDTLT